MSTTTVSRLVQWHLQHWGLWESNYTDHGNILKWEYQTPWITPGTNFIATVEFSTETHHHPTNSATHWYFIHHARIHIIVWVLPSLFSHPNYQNSTLFYTQSFTPFIILSPMHTHNCPPFEITLGVHSSHLYLRKRPYPVSALPIGKGVAHGHVIVTIICNVYNYV